MKKTIISVLCVVLIFIPTFIAIGSYIATQNSPISNNFVEKIDIADLDGNTYTVAKTKKDGDLVSFFVSMNKNALKVAELPEPLVGTPFYKVTFHSGNVAEDYKYYLDTKGGLSYSEYPDGSIHQLDPGDVNKFLITPYALSLFPDESLPILKTSTENEIIPSKVSWNYKLDGEKYSALSGFETTDELLTYEMEGSINLLFTSDADLYTIKVYNSSSELIYDASTEDLSTMTLDEGEGLTFMVTASWYEDNTREFYGEATYNFKTNLVAGAEFFIGEESTTVEPGDFVAITGYNIADPSKITFSSEPSIGYTPTFYKDGDHVIAFVPIDVNLEHKSYVFTISYGTTQQDINLAIKDKTFKKRTHTISKVVAENTRSEQALSEFNKVFEEICAKSEGTRLFEGDFTDYEVSLKASIAAGFGLHRTISSTKEVYRSTGVEWRLAAGSNITAWNSGKVVYAGITTHGGRMVVIDHGLGLKTWYMHMGEIKVALGDSVSTGDVIALAGSSGFSEVNGVFTMMTVGNIPVCPYRTWDTGTGIDIYTK
ncbi:MAG: M23 family metallopeptidase [Ruminococcaceae bacterium]|nr:M23 family metallopeptidase [Oscillospiraceae bacterium]